MAAAQRGGGHDRRGQGRPGHGRFDDLVDDAERLGLVETTGDQLVLVGELLLDLGPDVLGRSARRRGAGSEPQRSIP